MSVITDHTLHIHAADGQACAACGDADDGSRIFTTDVGAWNRERKSCSPGSVVEQDYTLSTRTDKRASALFDERYPDRKKIRGDDR